MYYVEGKLFNADTVVFIPNFPRDRSAKESFGEFVFLTHDIWMKLYLSSIQAVKEAFDTREKCKSSCIAVGNILDSRSLSLLLKYLVYIIFPRAILHHSSCQYYSPWGGAKKWYCAKRKSRNEISKSSLVFYMAWCSEKCLEERSEQMQKLAWHIVFQKSATVFIYLETWLCIASQLIQRSQPNRFVRRWIPLLWWPIIQRTA